MQKIRIMHLRLPAPIGWGGPDSGMLNGGKHLDPDLFDFSAVYLKRTGINNSVFFDRYQQAGVDFYEFEGKGSFDLHQFNMMSAFIQKMQPDIIHCHEERTDLYGYLLKFRVPTAKIIASIHGEWLIDSPRRWLVSQIDSWLLNQMDARIAVSKQVIGFASRLGIKIDRIVENGIDVDVWSPDTNLIESLPFSKPELISWVGFVGRLSFEKGPLEFVEMAAYISRQNKNVEFIVAGVGDSAGQMRQSIEEKGLKNKFHFLGEINHLQLRSLYKSLDALVCSSLSEGLPNNLLEASAMTTPIIATRVGGVPELIQDGYNGFLCDAGDTGELSIKVLQIINNSELARTIGANARKFVIKNFSVTAHAAKMGQLYQDVLNRSAEGFVSSTSNS